MYPKSIKNLIESFKYFQGIGEKTAERLAFSVLSMEEEQINNLSESLKNAKKNIKRCKICNNLSENDICDICNDKTRNHDLICLVEDPKTVFSIEKLGTYNGYYHVLNGLISPIEGVNPEDLNIASLLNRINEDVKEVVIALNPSIEGEVTSMYIQKILEKKDIKVSRLSYGIPMGSDIEYLDPIMMSKALEDRKVIS